MKRAQILSSAFSSSVHISEFHPRRGRNGKEVSKCSLNLSMSSQISLVSIYMQQKIRKPSLLVKPQVSVGLHGCTWKKSLAQYQGKQQIKYVSQDISFCNKVLGNSIFVYLPSMLKPRMMLFSWKKVLQKYKSVILKNAFKNFQYISFKQVLRFSTVNIKLL